MNSSKTNKNTRLYKPKYEQIRHGGNLQEAIQIYGGLATDWLDLSTGISPWAYPVAEITEEIWRNLPQQSVKLKEIAAAYYCCNESDLSLSPGSQLAIRLLPTLITQKQIVAVPLIGYQEHMHAWQVAGHEIVFYKSIEQLKQLISASAITSAVVINPNNPTGETARPAELNEIASKISGLLIVDEAFSDTQTDLSVIDKALLANIFILRSIGKFFGLAGARIGFLISAHPANKELQALFNPWSISAPSQYIAELALADTDWQEFQRNRLLNQSNEVRDCLNSCLSQFEQHQIHIKGGILFNSVFSNAGFIEQLQNKLAQQKIWSRIGDIKNGSNWLRLGLPGDELSRFKRVIESIK